MSNIGNLIALNIMTTRRCRTHTTYWENVPSTVYPLSFALEQPANHSYQRRVGKVLRVAYIVLNPYGTARIGDKSQRAT